ncbi:hypothetical protein Aperf_G00000124801 [Anoplocephala perfoliata]
MELMLEDRLVYVVTRGMREIRAILIGRLGGFDRYWNLVLLDVEEYAPAVAPSLRSNNGPGRRRRLRQRRIREAEQQRLELEEESTSTKGEASSSVGSSPSLLETNDVGTQFSDPTGFNLPLRPDLKAHPALFVRGANVVMDSVAADPIPAQFPVSGLNYTVGSLTEEEYRQWIEQTFKPAFEPYEQIGGMPCHAKRDGRITYQEFFNALVHKRYVDLPSYKRVGIRAMLAANPGMRLAAARTNAIKHLQLLDSIGRGGEFGIIDAPVSTSKERLPNAITGYVGDRAGGGAFQLEPDGVWPTSRKHHCQEHQDEVAITITEEEYIPEVYLKAFKCCPPPIFCPLIVLVHVAVYIYYAVELNQRATAEAYNALTWVSGFPYFSPLSFDPRRRREVWRFFTYMFIHEGIWHIVFNSFMTLTLGSLLEWVHGSWRMVVLYFAGILAGSLAASVWDTTAVGVGAAGGVFAVIGVYLALSLVNWEELKHDHYALVSAPTLKGKALAFAFSGITRIIVILLLSGLDFGISLYERYGLPDAPLHVTFSPSVAGLISGILVGVPLLRELDERPWYRVVFWACLAVSLALFIFALFWNIFWTGYPAQLV